MIKEHSNIDIELIHKSVKSDLTKDEARQLTEWLSDSKSNEDYYGRAVFYYKTKGVYNVKSIDKVEAWRKLENRLKSGRRYSMKHWYALAGSVAAVLVLIIMVTLAIKQPSEKIYVSQQAVVIEHGSRSAELELSDGRKIRLGTGSQDVIEDNGAVINLDDEEVSYASEQIRLTSHNLKNVIRVDRGEEFNLKLADGTKVWINSLTEIRFPVAFDGAIREVEILSGEAYFDVARDVDRPFVVKTPGHDVVVLGTAFNISCYGNDEAIETTLVEGLVQINNLKGTEESIIITPNQQYVYSKTTFKTEVKTVNAKAYAAWTKGVFLFEDAPLEAIFKRLERWYNINVFYVDGSCRDEIFSGQLPRFENVDVILDMMGKISDVEFELQGNTVIVK
ncbi:FecR family protein [Carboxylicivirga taeanensis]|uniref:FecR family protein n=1 Tax=Carboxylicivirga taeanensis TaxID=1416875 RepID=UPI003F6DEB07